MAMPVSENLPTITAALGQTSVIASAGGFAAPLIQNTNHLAGYHLAGLLHLQAWEDGIGGTGRFMTYRMPNCDYLFASAYVESVTGGEEAETDRTVAFTAGTGAGVSVQAAAGERINAAFPWGDGDDWEEVTYKMSDCEIRSISIWCLCRDTLSGTDEYIESIDTTNWGAGFNEGEYMIHDASNTGQNISGLLAQIKNVRNHTVRQAVSWSDPSSAGCVVNSASYANPFSSLTFPHTARWYNASTAQQYRVYAYTKVADRGAETYSWKATTAAGNVEKTGLLNADYAWEYMADLALVGSGTQSTITFEMKASASDTPTITIAALSIVAQPYA